MFAVNFCARLFEPTEFSFSFVDPAHTGNTTVPKTLTVLTLNAKQLYLDPSIPHSKRRFEIYSLANQILFVHADIVFLQEVGSLEALQTLVAVTGDQFAPMLIHGNEFGDIAVLVRKTLPFRFEYKTHRELGSQDGRPILVRDLPSLHIFAQGRTRAFLTLIGVHLKANRGDPVRDQQKRKGEIAQAEILARDLEGMAEDPTQRPRPLALVGDFQAEMRNSPELLGLYNSGYRDVLDFSDLEPDDRITSWTGARGSQWHGNQIDGLLANTALVPAIVSSAVIPNLTAGGGISETPGSLQERNALSTDHLGVATVFDLPMLLARP